MKHISRYLIPNGFDFLHCLKKIPLCCLPAKTQLQDMSWHFRKNFAHLVFQVNIAKMHEDGWWRQVISGGRFNLEEHATL